jgi:phosphoglycolate phosphatase
MIGEGAAVLVARAFAAAGLPLPDDALPRFLAIYDQHLLDHTRPYDGIPEAVEALTRDAQLAVLTNKPLAPSLRLLDALGLRRYFGDVVGGDGPFPRKPDPSALRHLMRAAAARAREGQTILVGDSRIDLDTARNGGVPVYLARYGFGFADVPLDRLAPTDRLVDSPRELVDAVRALGA